MHSLSLSAVLLALLPVFAWAGDKVSYPVQEIPLKNVKEFRIVGVKGSVRLRQTRNTGSQRDVLQLRVSHSKARKYDDWYLSVQRRGHTLFLEVFNTAYGSKWRDQIREDQWPEFDLDITANNRPATVSWREGFISVDGWSEKLDISFLKGQAQVRDVTGPTKLQVLDAQIDVDRQKGALNIQGNSGEVKITNLEAPLTLNWLSGKISCENCEGKGTIASTDSRIRLMQTSGEWNVNLDRGSADISGFFGLLKAKGISSGWTVKAAQGADVNVVSENGPVMIARQPGRSKVFLTSLAGAINAPSGFKKERRSGVQVVENLEAKAGVTKLGQVFVRTRTGAIHLW